MTEGAELLDLLPLLFFTALIVYALALGSLDLPRTAIRATAMVAAAFCLALWGLAALAYDAWGGPVIDDFYATDVLRRQVGAQSGGWLLLALAVLPLAFAFADLWRRRNARQQE